MHRRKNWHTYLYVKGDFEPIISEEQWDRCKQIRQQRTRYSKFRTENGEVLHKTGIHESGDVWTKKLKCRCGYKMRKNKWRKNKNGEVIYGYKCYACITIFALRRVARNYAEYIAKTTTSLFRGLCRRYALKEQERSAKAQSAAISILLTQKSKPIKIESYVI